jgi:glyoxylase-like metal-dependent hydrolase (beta-lactamase superfamily II)
MVCHCLLIESNDGLVLVDTGLGLGDIERPKARLGRTFTTVVRPRMVPAETAVRQIEGLGFRGDDVRHIVLTHMDLDHAGGLSDFPGAQVHVLDREHDAALAPPTAAERKRYSQLQWAHGPRWVSHSQAGETWMELSSVSALNAHTDEEILLVPLLGHSRGHCGVAVKTANGWLLHAGDSYFFHDESDPDDPSCPIGLRMFQRILDVNHRSRLANQRRLRELKRNHSTEVEIFCAHDPLEFDRMARASA